MTVPATAFVPLPAFLGDLPTTADLNIEIQGRPEAQFIRGSINVRRMEVTRDIDIADLIDQRREADITTGGGGGGGGGLFGALGSFCCLPAAAGSGSRTSSQVCVRVSSK